LPKSQTALYENRCFRDFYVSAHLWSTTHYYYDDNNNNYY